MIFFDVLLDVLVPAWWTVLATPRTVLVASAECAAWRTVSGRVGKYRVECFSPPRPYRRPGSPPPRSRRIQPDDSNSASASATGPTLTTVSRWSVSRLRRAQEPPSATMCRGGHEADELRLRAQRRLGDRVAPAEQKTRFAVLRVPGRAYAGKSVLHGNDWASGDAGERLLDRPFEMPGLSPAGSDLRLTSPDGKRANRAASTYVEPAGHRFSFRMGWLPLCQPAG